MAKEFTVENFEEEVLNSSVPVLVDFWAEWCGPCKALGPMIEELSQEAEGYVVGKVNVDAHGELAGKYQISSIPALRIFKNGEIVGKHDGLLPKEIMVALVEKALAD